MNFSYLAADYVLEEISIQAFKQIDAIDNVVHYRTINWCQQYVHSLCSSSNNMYYYQGLGKKNLQQCPETENKLMNPFSIKIVNHVKPTKTVRAKSQKRVKKTHLQIKNMKNIDSQSLQPKKNILKLTQFIRRQRSQNRSNYCEILSIKQNKQSEEIDKLPVWIKKKFQQKKSLYPEENKQKNNFAIANLLYNVSQPKLIKNRRKIYSDPKLNRSKRQKSGEPSQISRPQLKNLNKSRKQKNEYQKQNKIMKSKKDLNPAKKTPHKLIIVKKKDRIQIVNRARFRQYFPTFAKLYDNLRENLSKQ